MYDSGLCFVQQHVRMLLYGVQSRVVGVAVACAVNTAIAVCGHIVYHVMHGGRVCVVADVSQHSI